MKLTFLLFFISVYCFFICYSKHVSTTPATRSKEDEIAIAMNLNREVVYPPALRMPCLHWDSHLAHQLQSKIKKCKPPHNHKIIYDVHSSPQPYLEIFLYWATQNSHFHFGTDTCKPGHRCNEFKTIMNEEASHFACAQTECEIFEGLPEPSTIYYVTMCIFDKPTPQGKPYTISNNKNFGCKPLTRNSTRTTCRHPKTTCYRNLICCESNSSVIEEQV